MLSALSTAHGIGGGGAGAAPLSEHVLGTVPEEAADLGSDGAGDRSENENNRAVLTEIVGPAGCGSKMQTMTNMNRRYSNMSSVHEGTDDDGSIAPDYHHPQKQQQQEHRLHRGSGNKLRRLSSSATSRDRGASIPRSELAAHAAPGAKPAVCGALLRRGGSGQCQCIGTTHRLAAWAICALLYTAFVAIGFAANTLPFFQSHRLAFCGFTAVAAMILTGITSAAVGPILIRRCPIGGSLWLISARIMLRVMYAAVVLCANQMWYLWPGLGAPTVDLSTYFSSLSGAAIEYFVYGTSLWLIFEIFKFVCTIAAVIRGARANGRFAGQHRIAVEDDNVVRPRPTSMSTGGAAPPPRAGGVPLTQPAAGPAAGGPADFLERYPELDLSVLVFGFVASWLNPLIGIVLGGLLLLSSPLQWIREALRDMASPRESSPPQAYVHTTGADSSVSGSAIEGDETTIRAFKITATIAQGPALLALSPFTMLAIAAFLLAPCGDAAIMGIVQAAIVFFGFRTLLYGNGSGGSRLQDDNGVAAATTTAHTKVK
jgi:hypothetical protein